ncbi:amino acid/amide ABC transporter ATP-binding protein 1, HAAT family [Lentzea xinjiangensis]|uniref:Amino acid/amide ABC transporter ATP-binding protein 1, HAAT family n=1 Tax=Lentzea xinjiangensis TaxID=402600 RepID=A0A1H9QGT5_9PSEU|nr:ABC transporter ATP-binding protein [Lentzea xinjiangensis]SER59736.1 amino acid/amide ABC transporter ATP-binding protein 1, HAAT family [Lentzea xinjiangensis]
MSTLRLEGVTVRFGQVTAVDDVSLVVEPGVTGLIGPNGAGKTTLFDVVSGLRRPSAGRVLLDDEDITAKGPHQRSRLGVARTFQRLEVFGSLTVWENVVVALESRRRSPDLAAGLLERVGIAEFSAKQADTVPTGAARLLELARALATDPRLLLLDEPSSGLDRAETGAFGALLRELSAEGRSVVLVEHDMDLVMGYCDTVHVLTLGRLLVSGTPAAVRAHEGVREAYLG